MLSFMLKSPLELQEDLAANFKKIRLSKNLSRDTLAKKSGIPTPTIRRFEQTGDISIKALITLLYVMDMAKEIEHFLKFDTPTTTEEIKNRNRKRGTI